MLPVKTPVPKLGAEPRNVTDVKVLLANAESPIEVTEAGMVSEVSPAPSKAETAIPVTGSPPIEEGMTKVAGHVEGEHPVIVMSPLLTLKVNPSAGEEGVGVKGAKLLSTVLVQPLVLRS